MVDGVRYCHIINPKTGVPVSDFQSVSIFANSCLTSGALSTIAMLKGRKEGRTFLSTLGFNAMIVVQDGSIEFVQNEPSAEGRMRVPDELDFLK